jgi:hypothetical protein
MEMTIKKAADRTQVRFDDDDSAARFQGFVRAFQKTDRRFNMMQHIEHDNCIERFAFERQRLGIGNEIDVCRKLDVGENNVG